MLQLVNTGTAPDSGDGDDIRQAYEKINASLEFLQSQIESQINSELEFLQSQIESQINSEHRVALQNQFDVNSTVPATIPDLQFDVNNGDTWGFEVNLLAVNLDTTADLRAGTIAPAGSTGWMAVVNAENSTVRSAVINADTILTVTTGTGDLLKIIGIVNAAADGVLQFQLRNNTGTNLQSFQEGSWLSAKKIS